MPNTIKIGEQLPDISTKITLIDNKPILINFFATWCGPCVQELPDMQKLFSRYKNQMQFVFIHCGGDEKEVEAFMEQNGYSSTVVVDVDNSIAQQFSIRSIPLTIITDRDKIVKKIIVGARSYKDYEQEIIHIL